MTQKWYAVYIDNGLIPSALFEDLAAANAYVIGKHAKIILVPMDSDVTSDGQSYLMSIFASFNPWKKG